MADTTKPGYKTTEFYLSLLATLVGFLIASGAVSDAGAVGKIIAFAASILTALGYTVARTFAKRDSVQ
jgi:hypothetical protein